MNKMTFILPAIATLMLTLSGSTSCNNNKIVPIVVPPKPEVVSPPTKAMGDYMVATDALGRTLPSYEEVGKMKENRHIGLFYWLWHCNLRNESSNEAGYNNTVALSANPTKTDWAFADHYWGKPELGYYRSNDEFVMQKHLNLFTLVGIDFLYLDFTNAVVDSKELQILLKLIIEMKEKGYTPPKLVSFLNHEPQDKIVQLYNSFYSNPDYADCWFIFDDKPLILSPEKHKSRQDINEFFTWRKMWAAFGDRNEENRGWWKHFDEYPMDVAINNGRVESGTISPGTGGPLWDGHLYGSRSSRHDLRPTYDQYWVANETPEGLFMEEQWDEAFKYQPPILCITGWNEWKAGAWVVDEGLVGAGFKFQGRVCEVGDMYFVDQFNAEFSRDLEPMEGGYTDNYFYQMAANIRRYKGMNPMPAASPAKIIVIDGEFDEWETVSPAYSDFEGDLRTRNNVGAPRGTMYTNSSARNDIVETRVAYDKDNVYFYVKTAEPLTSHSDPFWMMLYIDADKNKATGWEGYDYLINHGVKSDNQTTLKKRDGNNWSEVATLNYKYSGNRMEIAVPKSAIVQSAKPDFHFHWHDNIETIDDLHSFFVNGDSAPERRYNYHYKAN